MNKTLLERVKCMLSNANLHKRFWVEAVTTTTYLLNRYLSTAIGFKTPEDMWSGIAPRLDHLRVFGCVAYAHTSQGNLESRAKKCMFLGYLEGVKGYKLWFLDKKAQDVLTTEMWFLGKLRCSSPKQVLEGINIEQSKAAQLKVELTTPEALTQTPQQEGILNKDIIPDDQVAGKDLQYYHLARHRMRRQIPPLEKYGFVDIIPYPYALDIRIEERNKKLQGCTKRQEQ